MVLKNRIGDWKNNTVSGKQIDPRLVTLVDRNSYFTLVGLAENKSAEAVTDTTFEMLGGYQKHVKTINYGNDKEFAGHFEIAKYSDSKANLAHPYSSRERGLIENTSGLLR